MAEPTTSDLLVNRVGPTLRVTFNRPRKFNAMTWQMYDGLEAACEAADNDPDVRVLLLRGARNDAFVAGTDIAQFRDVSTGAAGIAYEQRITDVLSRLEAVRVPAVAGHCLGAGLAIAAACDVRIAADNVRFGVPIAATLGNCLSMSTHALLVAQLGYPRTMDLLLTGRYAEPAAASSSRMRSMTRANVSAYGPCTEK